MSLPAPAMMWSSPVATDDDIVASAGVDIVVARHRPSMVSPQCVPRRLSSPAVPMIGGGFDNAEMGRLQDGGRAVADGIGQRDVAQHALSRHEHPAAVSVWRKRAGGRREARDEEDRRPDRWRRPARASSEIKNAWQPTMSCRWTGPLIRGARLRSAPAVSVGGLAARVAGGVGGLSSAIRHPPSASATTAATATSASAAAGA